MLRIKTSQGDIKIKLSRAEAPKTVENFMKHVDSGHYDMTIFHRVIDNFMIQGGGFTPDMRQKNAPHTVENEADNGLKNVKGSLAMARTMDPHSAGAQFFINVADNDFLNHKAPTREDWGYCVFAHVTEGMDVVEQIRSVPTGQHGPHNDVPLDPVIIESIEVVG